MPGKPEAADTEASNDHEPGELRAGAPRATTQNLMLPAHAPDIADYTLRATLDPTTHSVAGKGRIHWTNTSAHAVRDMYLHLYLNAFKNESSVFLRDPVGGFRGGQGPTTWGAIDVSKLVWKRAADAGGERDLIGKLDLHGSGDAHDETDARVDLGDDIAPGTSIDLDVEWTSKLPSVVMRTGFSDNMHMVGQWFPKVAVLEKDGTWTHFPFHHLSEFYADYGTYDVTIDVPEAYVIGATGPLVSEQHENGRRIERHVQGDIHDFAWTAWDLWQQREETIDGVKVRLLFPPGYETEGERDLNSLRFAIPHFGERYGKYPYSVLTVMHPRERDNEAGGMEYPTLITTMGPWWGPPGVHMPELVTVHEFGHQYFYGLLASNENRWPFLDEGFNSYAESIALEHQYGVGGTFSALGIHISGQLIQAVTSRRAALNEPVARNAGEFVSGSDYGALVYQRTAALLDTTSRVFGKEAMIDAMRDYAYTYRFTHPTPDDFLGVIERHQGPVARAALEEGLLRRGWIDYEPVLLDCGTARESAGLFDRNGTRETVAADKKSSVPREVGVAVVRRGTMVLPVDVDLTFDDGTTRRVTWDGRGETARLSVLTNRALVSAVVDPEHKILLDDDYANNRRVCRTHDKRNGGRLLELFTFFGEMLANGVSP